MGTYNKGILGAFSGKVGSVVGSSWRGQDVMRSLPRKSGRIPSEVQRLQRLRFSTVSTLLTPIHPILSRYYGGNTTDKTRNNQATSYHLKEALHYVAPNMEVLYDKIQISKGDLIGLQTATVAPAAATSIDLTWVDNSGQGQALDTDQLVVAVYEPLSKAWFYSLNLAARKDVTANMPLPTYLTGLHVYVYAMFAATDEKQYATSLYLGKIVLT